MKKILCLIQTVLLFATPLFACTAQNYEIEEPETEISLDGKKIIFIGDSFIYYGNLVLEKSNNVLTQEARVNDKGYFYQLCKANGENVSVTNWTFGGHGISATCKPQCTSGKSCTGVDHMSYLTDRYYDYVVLSGGRKSTIETEDFLNDVRFYMDFFGQANPNVKFLYLVSSGAHNVSVAESFPVNILNNLKTLESWGITIVDWGKLVKDIIDGTVKVPGAREEYNKNSFIVSKSEADGYHPNQLSGYITSLMTYCAIKGVSAIGQTYDFCGNRTYETEMAYHTFYQYIKRYYKDGAVTNYNKIFASESDMRGLQALINRYLEEKAYRNYDF